MTLFEWIILIVWNNINYNSTWADTQYKSNISSVEILNQL